jgi:hypothetical protein
MKPLTANLKTLYQCRYLWIFHSMLIIVFLGAIIAFSEPEAEFPLIGIPLISITLYGEFIAIAAGDILSKPFGFCLPGLIGIVRRFIVFIWLSIMIIFSLIVVVLYSLGFKTDYGIFIGHIGLLTICYWMGITVIINRWMLLLFLFVFLMPFFLHGMIGIETLLMPHPGSLALLSGILGYLVYRAVGRRENARRLCTKPGFGFGNFSARAQARFKRERMRRNQDQKLDRASESAGSFFSGHIRSNHHSTLLAHLWGQVYLIIGPIVAFWRAILLSIVLFSLGLCLLQQIQGQGLYMFLLMIFITASVCVSIIFQYHRFDISLLIGRKEYFWRGIVLLFTVLFMSLIVMAVSLLLFNLLSGILPPITFDSKPFSPAMNWILLVFPVIMIPLFGGLFILFRKTILMISIIIMLIIVMVASLSVVIAVENAPLIIGLIIVLSAIVMTWGCFLAVLYYDSMKRSLC